jgi:hypothetical protein
MRGPGVVGVQERRGPGFLLLSRSDSEAFSARPLIFPSYEEAAALVRRRSSIRQCSRQPFFLDASERRMLGRGP